MIFVYRWLHLLFNLGVQLVVGLPLEMVHGSLRIGAVYMAGVLAGELIFVMIPSSTTHSVSDSTPTRPLSLNQVHEISRRITKRACVREKDARGIVTEKRHKLIIEI